MLSIDVLPKSHRDVTKWGYINPIAQGLADSAEQRTRRLLKSFDELEREVWGCASQINIFTSQLKMYADPVWVFLDDFGDKWWGYWNSTLDRALRVQVPENRLTEEFREARRIGLENREIWSNGYNERNWAYYELRRISRHKWGQYIRSNMNWDWDLGACLNLLFKIEKLTHEGQSPAAHSESAPCPAVAMGSVAGESWSILAEAAHVILPKEIKIAYKTKGGKTEYISFVPASSSPDHHSISETANSGPSGVEQDIKNLEAGTAHFNPVEALYEDCEGLMESTYGVEVDEVRMGGDAISMCSLD